MVEELIQQQNERMRRLQDDMIVGKGQNSVSRK